MGMVKVPMYSDVGSRECVERNKKKMFVKELSNINIKIICKNIR